jgi:ABC-type phosphate transport system substrate-binding protein
MISQASMFARFSYFALVLLWIGQPRLLWAEGRIAVIAHKGITPAIWKQKEVARIFLGKKLFWENGVRVIPVNLPVEHPIRRHFSSSVLGALPEDFEEYWNAQYFHGIAPPYVLASEEAVRQFVATTPGAIGYVEESLVNDQVQVVLYLTAPH